MDTSVLKSSVRKKFSDPELTAKGEARAWVEPTQLDTLWFNTGTLCNLQCENCYIESSPKNDRLVYITLSDVRKYLDEIKLEMYPTSEIAFTGGEPFMNPNMISILRECLTRGFNVLVLTNAMKPMEKRKQDLLELHNQFGSKLNFRISLDHYTEELHAAERGDKAWAPAMKGIQWLAEHSFSFSIAGRTLWNESELEMREGFKKLFLNLGIKFDVADPMSLILFPEMDEEIEVPEISTACWDILKKSPSDMMCANSRVVVKRKGQAEPVVTACTLLPYDRRFEMGSTLKESNKKIMLNHPHCAKFCVLGGGSCSVNKE